MDYNYSEKEIKKMVVIGLGIFLKNDSFLLTNDANERSISHKLAEYLQLQFPDWNVDCEYNRKGLDIKILDGIRECSEQMKTERVLPDIIIHERGTSNNLLVIEIKVESKDQCDIKKLALFTSDNGEYKYKLGLFINFKITSNPSLIWFKEGEMVQ